MANCFPLKTLGGPLSVDTNVQMTSFHSGLKATVTSSSYSSSEFDKEDSGPPLVPLYSLVKGFLKTLLCFSLFTQRDIYEDKLSLWLLGGRTKLLYCHTVHYGLESKIALQKINILNEVQSLNRYIIQS